MKMKRAVMIAVLAVAVAELVVPLIGSRTHAAGGADARSSASVRADAAAAVTAPAAPVAPKEKQKTLANGQDSIGEPGRDDTAAAPSPEVRKALGLRHVADVKAATKMMTQRLLS